MPDIALPFTLYWRALSKPDMDYTAFAHLLDADGNKVAQHDWQPRDAGGPPPQHGGLMNQSLIARACQFQRIWPGVYRMIVGM